jgi:hypothetical protein
MDGLAHRKAVRRSPGVWLDLGARTVNGLRDALSSRPIKLCGSALVAALFLNLGAAGALAASGKALVINPSQQTAPSVSGFLALRDAAFERQRVVFFNDPGLLQALKAHQTVKDPVEAFAARTLVRWATESPPSIEALENFIVVEAPLRTKNNRKAGPPGNEIALLQLASRQQDPQQALDYLMLRALTRPGESKEAYRALASLYYQKAPTQPEAWIRIAVEDGTEEVLLYFVEQSLPKIPSPIAKRVLDAERVRLLRSGRQLPAVFEQYRAKLPTTK